MENVVFPDECEVFFQANVRNIFELKILFFKVINKKFFFRQKIGSFKHAPKKLFVKNVFWGVRIKIFLFGWKKIFVERFCWLGVLGRCSSGYWASSTSSVQMNINQSSIYIKDLSCLNFEVELKIQKQAANKGPKVLHTRFAAYLTYLSNNWEHHPRYDNSILCKSACIISL